MSKVRYWLKLPQDFFNTLEIKRLRNIAGGDTYTIIYQKMLLHSLDSEGYLMFEGICDSFAEELALVIDEDPENVMMTINYLLSVNLMEDVSNNEAFLTRIPEMFGKETDKAAIMRKKRAAEKMKELSSNQKVLEE